MTMHGTHDMTEPAPEPIELLVVDPAPLGRACTEASLSGATDLRIVAVATVVEADRDLFPDVVLFQGGAGAHDGPALQGMGLAARRWPKASMIVVTDSAGGDGAMPLFEAGAAGILDISGSIDCILSTIRLVANGRVVYPAGLMVALRSRLDTLRTAAALPAAAVPQVGEGLTRRQQEVLELLALGHSNKSIAQRLRISESTVKVHIRGIMMETGGSNRTAIVARFLKTGGHCR